MKKLLLALALMLPMVVFTACEKEEENGIDTVTDAELVGTWVSVNAEATVFYQFNADHSGCSWREGDEESLFTWYANKNILTIIYKGEGTAEYTYSINNDYLTLFMEDEDDSITCRRLK